MKLIQDVLKVGEKWEEAVFFHLPIDDGYSSAKFIENQAMNK
jgi:hypothetical protein